MNPKISFHRILPSCLNYIPPQVTAFLDKAVTESPTSDLTVADAIAYSRTGEGDIYAVMDGETPAGAVFYMYGQGNSGRILDVALLGGDNFMTWRNEVYDFTVKLARMKECRQIWVMGRKGWGKIFPQMQEIGRVYCLGVGSTDSA